MNPRILHVSQAVDAGVGNVVAALVEDQVGRGWDVAVACPDGELPERAAASGATVHRWPAVRSPVRGLREWPRLKGIVGRVRPQVVHLHSAKAGLVGRQVLRGALATVFQPHAWSFDAVSGPTAVAALRWERFAARWTDRLICVSADELAVARREGIEVPADVVPNGVDTERLRPTDRAAARARLGLGDEPLAVCVGRVAEQKGQDLLLSAWRTVHERVPAARLALLGDGPRFAEWSARTAARTDVRWLGAGAPDDWYAAADVVVVPSRWEGMALVPLEAMACGRPVVAFDVTGIAESIGTDGTAGTVVRSGDVPALAHAVAALLGDPDRAAAAGRAARDRMVTSFDVRRSLARTAGIVEDLLHTRERTGGARA